MNLKIKKYLFVLLVAGISLSICGCNGKVDNVNNSESSSEVIVEQDNNVIDNVVENTTEPSTENNTKPESTENNLTADDIVINYYDDLKNKINEYIKSKDYDGLKAKGKEIFITSVDFLFYNGDIKGVYLKDISDKTKELVVQRFIEADETISLYVPDYKDTISSKYKVIKDITVDLFKKLGNGIVNYLGEEVVDEYGTLKKDFIDALGDTGSVIKDKFNDWYNSYKSK